VAEYAPRRAALERILRAASAIANEREFIVIGSLPLPADRLQMVQAGLARLLPK
jgi:hypothetical protein